jgi:hypothetical protein
MKQFLLLMALASPAYADKEVDAMLKDTVVKYNIPVVPDVSDNVTVWERDVEVWQPAPRYVALPKCQYGYDVFGDCKLKSRTKIASKKAKKVSKT